jgi:hypothetical protein
MSEPKEPKTSLTAAQKTNLDGFPKAAELIEITGAHALEASDRAILNLLYQYAHDSGRLTEEGASWVVPMSELRPSPHESNDRLRQSLDRLLSVKVNVSHRNPETGEPELLLTHLFSSFKIPDPSKGKRSGVPSYIGFRVDEDLRKILARSGRWGRIKAEIVCAMTSKYAIALYEMVQLRAGLDRCVEQFPVERFRELLGVPPGTYESGSNFVHRVLDVAAIEVNGLSEMGVKVEVVRQSPRAPITAVTMAWWRKEGDEFRAAVAERNRSKEGRMARLRGMVETATPLALAAE